MTPEQADNIRNAIQCLNYCLRHEMVDRAIDYVKRIDLAVQVDVKHDGVALLDKAHSLLVLSLDKLKDSEVHSDLECLTLVLLNIIESLKEE